jgi:hypothetical protein
MRACARKVTDIPRAPAKPNASHPLIDAHSCGEKAAHHHTSDRYLRGNEAAVQSRRCMSLGDVGLTGRPRRLSASCRASSGDHRANYIYGLGGFQRIALAALNCCNGSHPVWHSDFGASLLSWISRQKIQGQDQISRSRTLPEIKTCETRVANYL